MLADRGECFRPQTETGTNADHSKKAINAKASAPSCHANHSIGMYTLRI